MHRPRGMNRSPTPSSTGSSCPSLLLPIPFSVPACFGGPLDEDRLLVCRYAPVANRLSPPPFERPPRPLDRRFPSSGNRYENTVGPGCQGTHWSIGLVVRRYSALASRKRCTIL